MTPDADYASLCTSERAEWWRRTEKFCGRLRSHAAHGWICGRTAVRCRGASAPETSGAGGVTGGDPIELVQALARGAYRPRTKRTR